MNWIMNVNKKSAKSSHRHSLFKYARWPFWQSYYGTQAVYNHAIYYQKYCNGNFKTHVSGSNVIIIGSDNGLSPDRRQAVIWTRAGI